ncbi:MAG: type II toxin-antitoxin system HicB family antitoxin [Leptospiraceae bacterium]|nr:type II toxin-antitoxin system HicB family antitoxin [Leptospiraceae bacterium]MDW8305951.1 type II toxin-antitoxin system HicB family antitoxin [Leptospiraceae bacterium]
MDLSIKVWPKDGEYVASCPELDVFTFGQSPQQAVERLKKVIVFYAETASQLGYKIDAKELLASLNLNRLWPNENQYHH